MTPYNNNHQMKNSKIQFSKIKWFSNFILLIMRFQNNINSSLKLESHNKTVVVKERKPPRAELCQKKLP